MAPIGAAPRREIIKADALEWIAVHPAPADSSVITSLPDISELPRLGLAGWTRWFVDAVCRVVRWVPASGVAIFYQSDIRHDSAWFDKGHLVMRGADEEGARIVWHKIICRKPPGTVALGRPSYSHMIALTRGPIAKPKCPGPDVLGDAGSMSFSRAMGTEACRLACSYLRDETTTRTIVDPFCGRGTVLAVANEMGFGAIGIDISAKRCRAARRAGTPSASPPRTKQRRKDEPWER
jgi:hypothetical protein